PVGGQWCDYVVAVDSLPSITESTRLKPLIGEYAAGKLRSQRGIETVGDLLAWVPTRYASYESDLSEAREGEHLVAVGEVTKADIVPRDRSRRAVGKNAIVKRTRSEQRRIG